MIRSEDCVVEVLTPWYTHTQNERTANLELRVKTVKLKLAGFVRNGKIETRYIAWVLVSWLEGYVMGVVQYGSHRFSELSSKMNFPISVRRSYDFE